LRSCVQRDWEERKKGAEHKSQKKKKPGVHSAQPGTGKRKRGTGVHRGMREKTTIQNQRRGSLGGLYHRTVFA